jgi:hypothetical protein
VVSSPKGYLLKPQTALSDSSTRISKTRIAVSSQSIQIIAKTEEELFNLYESIAFVPLLSIHLGRQVSGTHFAKRFPNEKEVRLHYENTRKQTKRKSLWKQFFGL